MINYKFCMFCSFLVASGRKCLPCKFASSENCVSPNGIQENDIMLIYAINQILFRMLSVNRLDYKADAYFLYGHLSHPVGTIYFEILEELSLAIWILPLRCELGNNHSRQRQGKAVTLLLSSSRLST